MSEYTPHIGVREITTNDGDFLIDMVLEAVNWDRENVTRRGVLSSRQLSRYATGWGRQGDLGLVAIDLDGPQGLQIPIGAAWIRYFASHEPGYGFLEPGVPELSLSIVPGRRRLGIGRALLSSLMARAQENGVALVSLSVARANPAVHLYEQAGFAVVEGAATETETTVTMVADLAQFRGGPSSPNSSSGVASTSA